MPRHIQYIHQRVHVALSVTSDSVTVPAPLAATLPDDPALINVLVSQGYVLHDMVGGDEDLNWTINALQGDNTRTITFNRNLDTEWVKIQWLG